jgi:SNF2 family DNA or RNA helicase
MLWCRFRDVTCLKYFKNKKIPIKREEWLENKKENDDESDDEIDNKGRKESKKKVDIKNEKLNENENADGWSGEKILIFTNFVSAIDLLKSALYEQLGINSNRVLVLDGASKDRGDIVGRFQRDDDYRVMILNYAVGAQGLNLTRANHVILMNQWWCPTVHKQAVARSWRIGQTRPVTIYKMITGNTIEESMIEKYNNEKIRQIDDLYDAHQVKLDQYTIANILGISSGSNVAIRYM